MILYIKHIDIEGPGTLGDFLQKQGLQSRTFDLGKGDYLVNDFDQLEAVVCLGGPMNVYEEDKYPFLKQEHTFIQEVLKREIPFLGICLGSQLLAKATGAEVKKSPEKEIGFFPVQLTKAGQSDPLFEGLPEEIEVYQWHEDMFTLPKGAKLLATAQRCPHQAFKIGSCAYGLQFHVEITDVSISEWSNVYISKQKDGLKMKRRMFNDYIIKKESFYRMAQILYNNFVKIMTARKVSV